MCNSIRDVIQSSLTNIIQRFLVNNYNGFYDVFTDLGEHILRFTA